MAPIFCQRAAWQLGKRTGEEMMEQPKMQHGAEGPSKKLDQ